MVCPCRGCCLKLQRFIRKIWYPTRQAAHGGRRRTDRRRKHHRVRGRTRLEPPSEYLLHSSELEYRQGRHGFVAWALSWGPSAMLRFLISSCLSELEHPSVVGYKRRDDIVRCHGLDCTAHSEHDRAGHSTHSRGTGDTLAGGTWPSIVWLFVPFRHVTPVERSLLHACTHRHRIWFLFFVSPISCCCSRSITRFQGTREAEKQEETKTRDIARVARFAYHQSSPPSSR